MTPKRNPQLLVIEDDKFFNQIYAFKFTKAGIDVSFITDGTKAVSAAKKLLPDIILLDIIMPGKDGFAVLEELKQDAKLIQTPVIIASNLGQPEEIDRAINLGAAEYKIKSDTAIADLVDLVLLYIGKKK